MYEVVSGMEKDAPTDTKAETNAQMKFAAGGGDPTTNTRLQCTSVWNGGKCCIGAIACGMRPVAFERYEDEFEVNLQKLSRK